MSHNGLSHIGLPTLDLHKAPARTVLNNAGDHLHIDEPNAAVSAR
jgi:hypothetical protein